SRSSPAPRRCGSTGDRPTGRRTSRCPAGAPRATHPARSPCRSGPSGPRSPVPLRPPRRELSGRAVRAPRPGLRAALLDQAADEAADSGKALRVARALLAVAHPDRPTLDHQRVELRLVVEARHRLRRAELADGLLLGPCRVTTRSAMRASCPS